MKALAESFDKVSLCARVAGTFVQLGRASYIKSSTCIATIQSTCRLLLRTPCVFLHMEPHPAAEADSNKDGVVSPSEVMVL